jgi:environmental stress-induced protein Ves
MKVSIFDNQDFSTTEWSGGSTRQLYISPSNATIAARNFDVRISTALVEVNESTFTSLNGVHRKLMVLEGEIELSHHDHHSKSLKPFEVDVFSGDWKTKCIGTCSDFNLMTTGSKQSDLSSLYFAEKGQSNLELEEHWKTLCLYVLNGSLQIDINQKKYSLVQDQLLVIDDIENFTFPLNANDDCRIVIVKVG